MSKKQLNIKPKVWPKEYTFEEFKKLNPSVNENLLINYYQKYLLEYSRDRSRFIKHFEDNKQLISDNLTELKQKYNNTEYFQKLYRENEVTGLRLKNFTPTDIGGLTHWFKVESSSIQSQDIAYNDTTNVQEIVSWSSAVGDSHLVKESTIRHSGYYANDFVTLFRGRTHTGQSTDGQRMKLTDSPRFGAFTYFGVFEFNMQTAQILFKTATNDTGSVVFTNTVGNADATDRTILIQESTNTAENYRLVFANNGLTGSNIPDYGNYFGEQTVVANIDSFMSDAEKTDNKISGSTLASAVNVAINALPFYTSSLITSTKINIVKYPATSSITNLPSDGNFHNALGDSQTLVLSESFETNIMVGDNNTQTVNNYYSFWSGERINALGNLVLSPQNNNIHMFGRPVAITGSMRLFFGMAASSSIDGGDTTGTVGHITNDPAHNKKFVFMVTKDAPENAELKVYINNVSVFETNFDESITPTGSLDLDELAHFEPKFFGKHDSLTRILNGKVYEMGFYTGSLSESDRNQLYYYLGTKHNIHNYTGPSSIKYYDYQGY